MEFLVNRLFAFVAISVTLILPPILLFIARDGNVADDELFYLGYSKDPFAATARTLHFLHAYVLWFFGDKYPYFAFVFFSACALYASKSVPEENRLLFWLLVLASSHYSATYLREPLIFGITFVVFSFLIQRKFILALCLIAMLVFLRFYLAYCLFFLLCWFFFTDAFFAKSIKKNKWIFSTITIIATVGVILRFNSLLIYFPVGLLSTLDPSEFVRATLSPLPALSHPKSGSGLYELALTQSVWFFFKLFILARLLLVVGSTGKISVNSFNLGVLLTGVLGLVIVTVGNSVGPRQIIIFQFFVYLALFSFSSGKVKFSLKC